MLALVVAVGAVLIGTVRGGSLDALARTKFRWVSLLAIGLALQITFDLWSPEWMTKTMATTVVLASHVAVALFIVANRGMAGMMLIGIGLALNAVVIAANGAMPVSTTAAEVASAARTGLNHDLKHEPLDDTTLLPWLGDVIPVPRLGEVMSCGDLFLALGIGRLIYRRTTSSDARAASEAEASG